MKKRGKKPRAINVVKLTEKERKKYTKKYHCKRCHDFWVDTKELLEMHMEYLHGEYSVKKHQESRKGDKKLKKLYMERNLHKATKVEDTNELLSKPVNCFLCWCKNCEKPVVIHMDLSQEIQDDIVCPNCRANVFVDNRAEIVNAMIQKGKTPVQFKLEYGIDTSLFKGYTERELKLKAKGITFGEFVNRRNGKK